MPVPDDIKPALLERMEACIARQLAEKPKRLAHSRRVAQTAVELARAYGIDEFDARAAGLLHDYAKAYPASLQIEKARALGLEFGCDLDLLAPVLHGPIAAVELRPLFPELDECVFSAVERHTVACKDMAPLDMAIYVADGIEPGRPDTPAVEAVRGEVGLVPLEHLFVASLASSLSFVIETRRFLWPGSVETYNHYVLNRDI